MLNKLLLVLMLLPFTVFARIGQTPEQVRKYLGQTPAMTEKFGPNVLEERYTSADEYVVVDYYYGVVVAELFFNPDGKEVEETALIAFVKTYGEKWNPVVVNSQYIFKMIESADKKIRISYGQVAGTPIEHGVMVVDITLLPKMLEELEANKKVPEKKALKRGMQISL